MIRRRKLDRYGRQPRRWAYVNFDLTCGGTLGTQAPGIVQPFLDAVIQMPDAYPGNMIVMGTVQGVGPMGGFPVGAQLTMQTLNFGGNPASQSIALPGVPGSGTTNWNLQANVTNGVMTIQTQAGFNAVLAAGGSLAQPATYFYKVTATYTLTTPSQVPSASSGPATTTTSFETMPSNENAAGVTTNLGNQTATLTWPAAVAPVIATPYGFITGVITGYKIYRTNGASGTENLLVGTVAANVLTFSDTGFAGVAGSPPSIGAAADSFFPAALANNVIMARQALPTGATIPWFVGLQLYDYS